MTNEIILRGSSLAPMLGPAPPFDTSTPPTDGQALVWDATTGKYKPGPGTLTALLSRFTAAPVAVTYAASVTLDALLGCVFRVTATGNLTLADIINGIDGQTVALEVLASGADRTVTLPDGAIPITSGTRWVGSFRFNSTANIWLLI